MPLKLCRNKKKSPNWYIRGTLNGQYVEESTGTHRRQIAEAKRIQRENEILNRSVFGRTSTLTFVEAAVSYLEAGGEARYLGKCDELTGEWGGLIGRFMATPIADIGQDEADSAARALYPSAAPSTINRQVYTPLMAVLRRAGHNPLIRRPKQPPPAKLRPNEGFATVEWYDKLMAVTLPEDEQFAMAVMFMTYTGRRVSEVVSRDWDNGDIDLQSQLAYMGRTKNGDDTVVRIPSPVYEWMCNVEVKRGLVFGLVGRRAMTRKLKKFCKMAGIPYLSLHRVGRHTFATWMRRYAKLDLFALKDAGQWKSIESVQPYAHVETEELEQAAERLPKFGENPGRKERRRA